ncbi:hypothetical protein Golax_000961 [Gossypium laxum]|uniref:Uncharacterized protein n=1 Tax=Gossypium laxum TaxID=34288 RepID=A0A7J9AV91_9ROSI|nr:hypothetical protein [Gossypium laxum]
MCFCTYVFDTEKHCGVGEGSIINGFVVPLKENHKLLLTRVLLPQHNTRSLQVQHKQLAYCISQFVLGEVVVREILRYWPVTNCQKEIIVIGELDEVVENMDPDQALLHPNNKVFQQLTQNVKAMDPTLNYRCLTEMGHRESEEIKRKQK